ncbi:hypothetical protein [Bowmanella yangjiangensis]|uniref:Uncharacterized protein n=1 Tax=Bowmanella yangjiangensis TaxID=2811230 RepID=A0ABS3CRR9_9ALTE|nr:hypothetical protein [Bowmanella yangjiangensis]MBN7819807.1 hypothetical protein [Bowmanella yangjiangensis]
MNLEEYSSPLDRYTPQQINPTILFLSRDYDEKTSFTALRNDGISGSGTGVCIAG